MSATSAFSASRGRARNSTRSRSAARATRRASIGEIVGKGFSTAEVVDAVETIVDTYIAKRESAGRALPRRLSPARAGAVQGGALWRCLRLSPARSIRAIRPLAHAELLNERFAHWRTRDLLDEVIHREFAGRIALVSSFGAESVVLLHLVASVDPATPGHLHRHRQDLRLDAPLSRRDRRAARPDRRARRAARSRRCSRRRTPIPACGCAIPTSAARSARSRRWRARSPASTPGSPAASAIQGGSARELPLVEADGDRIKINPLADWTQGRRRRLSRSATICPSIRSSPTASARSAACPARRASPRARTSATAAGAARTRPNAASISASPRSRRTAAAYERQPTIRSGGTARFQPDEWVRFAPDAELPRRRRSAARAARRFPRRAGALPRA